MDFVLGIGIVIARFHRSGTTPSVMEQLEMSQRGVSSSGANSRSNLGGMSSGPGDLLFALLLKCWYTSYSLTIACRGREGK